MRLRTKLAAMLLLALYAACGLCQDYPRKPVRLIVSFPAGGPNDILGRAVAQKLSGALNQQMIVENRAGAGGIVGTELTAKAPADGYTLLLVAGGHAINASLYPKLPYDTLKDFSSVAMLATIPSILAVHPSLPVNSLKTFIALAQQRPEQLTFASAGNGTVSHLAGEMLKSMAGIRLLHVPYKGNSPATTALITGEVAMYIGGMPSTLPFVRSRQVRALAVTPAKRSSAAPDIPTIAESGLKDFDVSPWYGIVAPAGTPPQIISLLHREITKAMLAPDLRERLAALGFEISLKAPEAFDAFIRKEIAVWGRVIRASGAKVD